MRTFVGIGIAALLAASAYAEHPGIILGGKSGGFRTFGSRTGFGNILFPGTGSPPPLTRHPFSISDPGFAHRLGLNVSGLGRYPGVKGGGKGHRGGVAYPIPYPVFVGGYAGPAYPYEAAPPPVYQQPPANITIIVPPQGSSIVAQGGYGAEAQAAEPGQAEPNVRIYEAPGAQPQPQAAAQPAAPEPPAVRFLIAMKDSSVYTAVAYWVEGETLHYITSQGQHNQASLDLVDRELSERLNRGGIAEFRLPRAK